MAANDAQIKAMLADPEFAKLPHDQQDALLREAGADIPAPPRPEQSMSDRLQAMPIAQVVRGIGRGAMGQHAPGDASELEKGWAAGVGAANIPVNLLKALLHPIDTATGMAQVAGGAGKIALDSMLGRQSPEFVQLVNWARENPGEATGTALGTAASFPLGEGAAAAVGKAGKAAGRGIRSGAHSYAVSNATKALGFKDAAEAVGSVLPGETAVAGGPVQFLLDKGIFKLGGENNPQALLSRVMPIAEKARLAKAALMEGPLGKVNIDPSEILASLQKEGARAGRSESGIKVEDAMSRAAKHFRENQQQIAAKAGQLEPPPTVQQSLPEVEYPRFFPTDEEPVFPPAGPSKSYLPLKEADKLRAEYDLGYKEARASNPLDASAGAGDQAVGNALRDALNARSTDLATANATMHNTIPAENVLKRLIEARTAGLSGGGGAGTAGLAPTVASAPLSVAAPFHLTRAAVAGLSKAPAVRGQLAAMMYALSKMGTPAGDALLMRMLGQGVAATDEVGPAVANASTRSRGQQ